MSIDRFEELYERYTDGELTVAERGEFLRLLEDSACRARLVEISSYEASISEELRLAEAAIPKDGGKPSSKTWPKVGSRRVPILPPAPPDETRVLHAIGFAAAAAVLIILILIFVTSPKIDDRAPVVFHPPPALPRESATPEPAPIPVEAAPAAKARPSEEKLAPRVFTAPALPEEAPPRPAPAIPESTPPPSKKPASKEEAPRESTTFVAMIERCSREVMVGTEAGEAGKGIASGRTVATGRGGYVSVKYPDGTRVELAGETTLSRLTDSAGKSAQLEQGMIFVDAVKQPSGRPLVITTSQAECTVMGTQFVLATTPGFTRIDVREGRVKFTRLPQAVSSVMVNAGHYAIAGPGGDLAAKPGIALWKAPPAGLQMWLRADTGVKMNGATVSAWADQSTWNNTAVQDRPAAQPTFVANAFGGRPALRFDGVDDSFVLPDGFGDFRAGLTAFVVTRPAPGGAWSRFIDLDVGPACDNIVFGRKDAPDKLAFWVYSNSQTKGKVEAAGAVVADQVQSFCALLSPLGHVTLYRNGVAVAAGDTSVPKNTVRKPNGIAKSNSGGNDPLFRGEMFEILLYNRALSEAERLYVESYVNAKYFDPTTPPASLKPAEK